MKWLRRAAATALVLALGCSNGDEQPERSDVVLLVSQLRQPNPSVRRAALQSLTELGSLASGALPAVEQALAGASGSERGEAAIALGALDPTGERSLPGIRRVLADTDPAARELGALAAGLLGSAGAPALAQLGPLARDSSPLVRAAATYALLKVRPDRESIALAYALLAGDEPRGRFMALRAFRELGPSVVRDVEPIISALHDGNPGTQVEAIRVLEQLGPSADEALPELVALLRAGKSSEPALRALVAIDPSGNQVVAALRDCVGTCTVAEARGRAVAGLANYPWLVEGSISALRTALQDAEADVAMSALHSLALLRPDYVEVGPTLLTLVQEGQSALAWKAIEVLASYEEASDAILTLQSGPKRGRLQAAYALGKLPPSEAVQRGLAAARQDLDPDVRAQAEVATRPSAAGALVRM